MGQKCKAKTLDREGYDLIMSVAQDLEGAADALEASCHLVVDMLKLCAESEHCQTCKTPVGVDLSEVAGRILGGPNIMA